MRTVAVCLLATFAAAIAGAAAEESSACPGLDLEEPEEASDAEVTFLQTKTVLQVQKQDLHAEEQRVDGQSERQFPAPIATADVNAGAVELPSIVTQSFEEVAAYAREQLVLGSAEVATRPRMTVFDSVLVSLPLAPPMIEHDTSSSSSALPHTTNLASSWHTRSLVHDNTADVHVLEDKNIVGMHNLVNQGRPCVVYGIGVSPRASGERADWEEDMALLGCETHAFDCTVLPTDRNVLNKHFAFHQWCVGNGNSSTTTLRESRYVAGQGEVMENAELPFRSLNATMAALNNTHLDVLKFDIEGFEWGLLEEEILHMTDLPDQLSFELHTQGANEAYVPTENVAGRGYVQVNRLFLALHDIGYRVVSKDINQYDPTCAEFVLVHMNRRGRHQQI